MIPVVTVECLRLVMRYDAADFPRLRVNPKRNSGILICYGGKQYNGRITAVLARGDVEVSYLDYEHTNDGDVLTITRVFSREYLMTERLLPTSAV